MFVSDHCIKLECDVAVQFFGCNYLVL
uniref:Uncharacterized protein n=1 Tax=Anguilla anguilla TaxID=7936 RepID=A0A0E9VMW0_ANGAN